MLISTIPSHLWDDIWRIEIETLDSAGNLFLLFDLLNRCRIEVVASEGSINAFGRKHTMSFVIGCHGYHSGRDLVATDRIGKARATLPDLEYLIRLNFGDQLSFSDSGYPRAKIKRLGEYWRLANEIRLKSRILGENTPTRMEALSIKIDERRVRELLRAEKDQIFFTPAVDTKNRLVRLLFFASGAHAPEHIQMAFGKNHTLAMRRVFQLLFEMDQNVIKYQVRTGGNKATQKFFKDKKVARVARMDVTFEPYRYQGSSIFTMDQILEAVRQDAVLKDCDTLVCKSHSAGI